MIVIGGDAFIDLIYRGDGIYKACAGGSALNCAITAGLLGSEVTYISTLSTDAFGDLLEDRLTECNVNIRSNARSQANSSIAVVSFDEANQPKYALYRKETADCEVPVTDIIESLPSAISAFHIGSCALISVAEQDAWMQVVNAAKRKGAIISIDPNCRPSKINDPKIYRRGIARFFEVADLIKLSSEDLEFLCPVETNEQLSLFLEMYSPSLVVYTRGSEGLIGITQKGIQVQTEAVLLGELVDTIGAGDSVNGALLAEIFRLGLTVDGLASLDVVNLTKILTLAARVAGLNCTRAGCQPPTRNELDQSYS